MFFGLETMGYEQKILDKMRSLGAVVDYHTERSVSGKIGKSILKLAPDALNAWTEAYYSKLIRAHRSDDYQIVFMMKCDMPTRRTLEQLRNAFPKAQFRLHLWDSLSNVPGIEKKLDCFDRVTSFDRLDCERRSEFGFRPLFYADEIRTAAPAETAYDLSFCGTIHSDRYPILESVRSQCESLGLRFFGYYYLQSKPAFAYYKLTDKRYRNIKVSEFHFSAMPLSQVSRVLSTSRAVIDIQHPKQAGLTMRTIEALGAGRKLITTNADIARYDFYNPENVQIIRRENPVISTEFLRSKYAELPEEVYRRYSLKHWVMDVLTM